MINSLSKREKILLFGAGLLVILYLAIQFAILPLMRNYVEGIEERNHLRLLQRKVDEDIRDKSTIENTHKDAEQRFDRIKQEYPLLVPNEEVVTTLNLLCITNGLSPTRLNITTPPYPTASDDSEGTEETSLFTIITATVNVTGTYLALVQLLDEVDSLQYIRITNMSYSLIRDTESIVPTASITLNFELTYVNP